MDSDLSVWRVLFAALFALAIVAGAHFFFDNLRNEAFSQIRPCPPKAKPTEPPDVAGKIRKNFSDLKEWVLGDECENAVKSATSAANTRYVAGMMVVAVFGLPLAIFGLNRLGDATARRFSSLRWRLHEAARLQREQQASRARQTEITRADLAERQRIHRVNIINKLGAVTNYIAHFADPTYKDRRGFIRQQIADELRELVAKHPIAELRAIIAAHEELRVKVRNVSAGLQKHGIENEDIELMMPSSDKR